MGISCLSLEGKLDNDLIAHSPFDIRLIADEDDVHRCGRCQVEFTALEDFVQHKIRKTCHRAPQEALPTTPAATALLDQEVSPF